MVVLSSDGVFGTVLGAAIVRNAGQNPPNTAGRLRRRQHEFVRYKVSASASAHAVRAIWMERAKKVASKGYSHDFELILCSVSLFSSRVEMM